jgi:biopolymer transport protein ExbD
LITRRTNRRSNKFNRFILILAVLVVVLLFGNLYFVMKMFNEHADSKPSGTPKTDSLLTYSNSLIVDLPVSSDAEPEFKFELIIDKDLNCYFETEKFAFENMEDTLNSKLGFIENKDNIAIILKVDETLPTKYVVDLMNVLNVLKVKLILAVEE